jgi:hypothetical protein
MSFEYGEKRTEHQMTRSTKLTSRHASRNIVSLGLLLALNFALLAPPASAADSYTLEKATLAAPDDVAAPVRAELAAEALRVTGPKGPICEIWLRKAIPAAPAAPAPLGVGYPQIAPGSLVGVVRVLAPISDYRQQRVKPGVYTLRYALHPLNGDHMGISPLRDFLLLAPAALDADPAAITFEEAVARSKKTIGANHPAAWSLQSAEGAPGTPPNLYHTEEPDLWIIHLRTGIAGAAKPLDMSLVVVGHAPEA